MSSTIRLLAGCLIAAGVLVATPALAEPVPEDDLKAAFVYNFALFTEWPETKAFEGNNLNLCFNPASAMREALAGLGSRLLKGRKIVLQQSMDAESLRNCHVLFAGADERIRWPQIKKALVGAGVLTISDDETIGRDGSVISLSSEGRRVVFDIDLRAAREARLTLSSKLLRLARTVQ